MNLTRLKLTLNLLRLLLNAQRILVLALHEILEIFGVLVVLFLVLAAARKLHLRLNFIHFALQLFNRGLLSHHHVLCVKTILRRVLSLV